MILVITSQFNNREICLKVIIMKLQKTIVKFIVLICLLFSTTAFTQTLSSAKFKSKLVSYNGILIDVRTDEEYKAESIDKSISIDVNDSLFVKQIGKLGQARFHFLYCGIGKRSATALKIMKQEGFKHVYNREGGLTEWKKQSNNG